MLCSFLLLLYRWYNQMFIFSSGGKQVCLTLYHDSFGCCSEFDNLKICFNVHDSETNLVTFDYACSKYMYTEVSFYWILLSCCKFWIYWVGVNTKFTTWHFTQYLIRIYNPRNHSCYQDVTKFCRCEGWKKKTILFLFKFQEFHGHKVAHVSHFIRITD